MKIHWFGSHPSEGSVSMGVYRDSLLDALRLKPTHEVSCWPSHGTKIRPVNRWQRILGKYVFYPYRVFNKSNVDIIHFLDHSSGHLTKFVPNGVKKIATLHDVIPLRYGGELTQNQIKRFKKSAGSLRQCDAIISVSEYSKAEAVELLDLDPRLIHVVPNGVRPLPLSDLKSQAVSILKSQGAEFIVLSVGSILQRKNLAILPETLRIFKEKTGVNIALLRIGATLDKELLEDIKAIIGNKLIIELGRSPEEELWAAYRDIDVVFIPSVYEGFGLPVLEAFSVGKPVACSNSSSLPEVGGADAEYFNPNNPNEAAEALIRVYKSRNNLMSINSRIDKAASMTWEKHLEGVFRVYANL